MEPEEVDKLFNERLGRVAPTPPAELWNRLQDRIEAEMPQKKHEEKRKFGWLYYSVAAAIALLLAVGVVLRYQQPHTLTNPTIAQVEPGKHTIEPLQTITPAIEPAAEQTIAAITSPEQVTAPTTVEPTIVAKVEKPATVKRAKPAQPRQDAEERWIKVEPVQQPAAMLASQTTKPEQQSEGATMQTPVTFAAASSAAPVEIVIKRAVNREPVAIATNDEPEEASSFEKKQRLAKNIFKQVKNLSNGEQINLNELGVNTDKIALHTNIGKQKISKVINL